MTTSKITNSAFHAGYDEAEGEIRLFFEKGSLRLIGGWVIGIDAP
ncbi:MAG: hypothetical protein QXO77_05500 [Saccharolobus sp.]